MTTNINWDTAKSCSLKKWKDSGLPTPCIVRVSESSSVSHLPQKLLEEDLLLHSVVNHRKAICQCVDFVSKDGLLYFSNQKFSIPLAYKGWFEILSEDGKTASPCKTIEEVYGNNPDMFLVRSKVKAYLSLENGDPDYDKTRVIQKGEVLSIVSRMTITHGWRKQKKHILHCLDGDGYDIYVDCKSAGQFSPMAGPSCISGVHSIEGLISQFRLPLTVRIVSGQIPRVASENERSGVFRIMDTQKDTTALFLPLISHQKLLPVSTRTNLTLTPAANMSELQKQHLVNKLLEIAQAKAEKYSRTMQVLVSAKQTTKTYSACTLPLRKKAPQSSVTSEETSKPQEDTEEDILFAEVDDLYAYVRRGGVPPKPRPRSWANIISDGGVDMTTEGITTQPILSSNGKPRGLLATLTAGKFPSKPSSSLLRQQKLAGATVTNENSGRAILAEKGELPVAKREEVVRSYMERVRGSEESLQLDVDPYVDEAQYKSTDSLSLAKKKDSHHIRQRSLDALTMDITRPRLYSNPVQVPITKEDGAEQAMATFLERTKANYQQPLQAT